MIRVKEGLEFCKAVKEIDIKLLAAEAADILKKHNNWLETRENKITPLERFIIGLAYYEFYNSDNDNSDNAYSNSIVKQTNFCKQIGINSYDFQLMVQEL